MDLMLGGDLKFHLIHNHHFSEARARFYAAQVLLGLQHIHSFRVIYRDLKLENVLLDRRGNARLSDVGLAQITEKPIRGYAGTPGYTAPEMILNERYTTSVDIFSFGVLLFRMLCGSKPFKGGSEGDLDRAVCEGKVRFPSDYFSHESIDLCQGLLAKKPQHRLGCGGKANRRKIVTDQSIKQEIKDHPFFDEVDWGMLEEGYVDPPYIPNMEIHAPNMRDIGQFKLDRLKDVIIGAEENKEFRKFDYISEDALQEELTVVLGKYDENENFKKYEQQPVSAKVNSNQSQCCVAM